MNKFKTYRCEFLSFRSQNSGLIFLRAQFITFSYLPAINMFLSIFVVTITSILLPDVSAQLERVVKISKGNIRGSLEKYSRGQYAAFRGIPYAKPPTRSLRFQAPVEPDAWSETLETSTFGSKCPQWDSQRQNTVGDENCLFVNVYTPLNFESTTTSTSSFPVMVFIHGGNFQSGSAEVYDPLWFVESLVVLVTFNYRLGILGFLSTGDGNCPGNLGLKDQVLALKWVRDNISVFGGNTSSITLFGQGAGAASAFLHILSPQSQGLFHRAITQSGSPLCDWSVEENPRSYAIEVAQKLGCPTKSNSDLVNCMRNKPQKDILAVQKNEKTFGDYPLRAIPVVEKDGFLPDTPSRLLSSDNYRRIPLISGVNKDDGSIFHSIISSYENSLKSDPNFLLRRLIPMFLLAATDIRANIESVSQALFFHYFNNVDTTDVSKVLQPFINMTTDAMFVSCNYKTLQNYSKGARTYMYTLQYRPDNILLESQIGRPKNYEGVSHGDELMYLFNNKNDLRNEDNKKKGQFQYIWTTFAKTGEPTSTISFEYPKWEPYTAESKYYYLIDSNIQLAASYRQRSVDLWLNHLPALAQIKSFDDENQYKAGGFGWAMFAIALVLFIVVIVLAVILLRKSKSQYFSTKTEDK